MPGSFRDYNALSVTGKSTNVEGEQQSTLRIFASLILDGCSSPPTASVDCVSNSTEGERVLTGVSADVSGGVCGTGV